MRLKTPLCFALACASSGTLLSTGIGSRAEAAVPAAKATKKPVKRTAVFTGSAVPNTQLRSEPPARSSGHLEIVSPNFPGESLAVELYDASGGWNEEALDALYHAWRCRRTGTEKPIDPQLFEVLALIQDKFGKPIELVSGFRNQERQSSFHFHGSAADIRIKGVPDRELHAFVTSLDTGHLGFGKYPRAGFIHVDVRPQSYRWVDRSPPGGEGAAPARKKRTS